MCIFYFVTSALSTLLHVYYLFLSCVTIILQFIFHLLLIENNDYFEYIHPDNNNSNSFYRSLDSADQSDNYIVSYHNDTLQISIHSFQHVITKFAVLVHFNYCNYKFINIKNCKLIIYT